jgi:hypothetical protein
MDFSQLFFKANPGVNDLKKINISKYTAADFMELFNRMIRQLDKELKSGLKLNLPNSENYQNDFGSVDLSNELPLFKRYFEGNNFTHLEPLLDKFIHYQVKNGFWNKTTVKVGVVEQNKLKAQFELILKNQKALERNLDIFEELKTNFNTKIAEIDAIIQVKRTELEQIAQNLNTATSQTNEITALLASVTNKDTEISGILNNVKDKVLAVDTDISNYQETFKSIETDWNKIENELKESQNQTKINFEKSKEHVEYTESRKSEIELLTGMAADGALGSKFHEREKKLTDKIPFWRNAIIGMTILSIGWVVVVFTCIPAKFDNEWVNLGVNLLKTAPAFILLGFVFKQYSKERNLEEEYAFKSAVAMTLTAYSRMLAEGDRDPNKSRQEMLLKSISNLYTEPKIHVEKSETTFSFNTKHLKESVDGLKETVKNLKTD